MPEAEEPAPKKKSPAYRIGGVVLGVVLVLGIFVGAIPQFASYRDAWSGPSTGPSRTGWNAPCWVSGIRALT